MKNSIGKRKSEKYWCSNKVTRQLIAISIWNGSERANALLVRTLVRRQRGTCQWREYSQIFVVIFIVTIIFFFFCIGQRLLFGSKVNLSLNFCKNFSRNFPLFFLSFLSLTIFILVFHGIICTFFCWHKIFFRKKIMQFTVVYFIKIFDL